VATAGRDFAYYESPAFKARGEVSRQSPVAGRQ
jgi:hypothetical protein